jgi:undecaprenyl-diphosphatase
MDAETAGRYSFLISLPAVLGATILELPNAAALPGQEILMGLAGMAVAMVVGYASLGALMRILKNGKIAWFSPYCFVMCGVTVAILFNII